MPSWSTPMLPPCQPGCSDARSPQAVPPPAGQRSLSAITWAMAAEADGFPLVRHTVFFSRDYKAEFDAIARGTLPSEPTIYLCAQDHTDAGSSAAGPGRFLCLINAPATGDTNPLSQPEITACADRVITQLRRYGLHLRPRAAEATTPSGFNTLFPATGGALYGQATHGPMASFARPGSRTAIPGLYLAGGQYTSGTGRADGGAVRPPGSSAVAGGPRFDSPVPHGGYTWWYVDALSDDGAHGITLIAFIGSVFSPFYAWSRRRGAGDPHHHCALNVALYGRPRRWAMTERGRTALRRDATTLAIGPSALHWDGNSLTIDIAEVTAPLPSRLRGTVRITPAAITNRVFKLDQAGHHTWSPIAPISHVEVALSSPALRWSGAGYLDTNSGDRPLEADFVHWDWCRAPMGDSAVILYNATRRVGGEQSLALHIGRDGSVAGHAATTPRRPSRDAMADPAANPGGARPTNQGDANSGGHPVLRPFRPRHEAARASRHGHA